VYQWYTYTIVAKGPFATSQLIVRSIIPYYKSIGDWAPCMAYAVAIAMSISDFVKISAGKLSKESSLRVYGLSKM